MAHVDPKKKLKLFAVRVGSLHQFLIFSSGYFGSSLQLVEMALENQRGHLVDQDGGAIDPFPVGLRVLAVDDDPICLKVIETLLRKCEYHVTTTNQAAEALIMLNRNKFDLVITDLNMPGMDGFMLLELVRLQMDLPVIMLSAHSDTKLVMKGVKHGACDYLLKPVRIEELSNIWQHVLRRKKSDSKDQNKGSNEEKGTNTSGGVSQNNSADHNKKPRKKTKDQDEEEEEEFEGNGDDDDPSTRKKARVVWSVELRRKFDAAVNQLGLEKAVPKKILNLMNVEGLTRENVASHLQKYRLSLKKKATQQASMVAALGGSSESYLRMAAIDGYGDFCTSSGSGRISSTTLTPYASSSGIFGRLNSPAGLSLRGNSSSALIPPVQPQVEKFSSDIRGMSNDAYMLEQMKSHDGFIQNYWTLDDIMGAMVKRVWSTMEEDTVDCLMQEQNEMTLMDGEMGFDAYPVGSCI